MSNSKQANIDELSAMFKALSNPQRLRIFLKLTECCGPAACDASKEGLRRCVGDLGEDLDVQPSTVSHHIKELRQAGLLQVQRRGQKIECWACDDALGRLATFFSDVNEKRRPTRAAHRVASTGRR